MKVCPSCNARLPDEAPTCSSCDHEFEAEAGDQKKTMMGMPALAEDSEENVDDKTSQVDPSELADALQGSALGADDESSGGDEPSPTTGADPGSTQQAADAWGVGDEPSTEDGDVGATEVVDPDELDFPESFDDDFSLDEADETSESVEGPGAEGSGEPQQPQEPQQQEGKFGTLSGMSADGISNDGDGGASMQVGGGESDDQDQDDSTQALSPDELAGFDEMALGGKPDWEETEESGDDQQTAVVGEAGDGDDFQLPKPGEDDSADLEAPEGTGDEESEETTGAPPSGVFRSVGESSSAVEETSSPDSDNLSDTGVTGTGTYQMSEDTGTGSEAPFDSSDNLEVGGVGSGGNTRFPAGADDEDDSVDQADELSRSADSPESGPLDQPETGTVSEPTTGPSEEVAVDAGSEPEAVGETVEASAGEAGASDSPFDDLSLSDESLDGAFEGGFDDELDGGVGETHETIEEFEQPDEQVGEPETGGGDDESGLQQEVEPAAQPGADPSARSSTPGQAGQSSMPDGGGRSEAEGAAAGPISPQQPESQSPTDGAARPDDTDVRRQSGDAGRQSRDGKPRQPQQPQQPQQPGGEPTRQPQQSQQTQQPQQPQQPGGEPTRQPSPSNPGQSRQPAGVPSGDQSAAPSPDNQQPGPAPSKTAPDSAQAPEAGASPTDQSEQSDSEGLSLDKMIMLLQRGVGALAAIAMVVVTVGVIVVNGAPEAGVGIAMALVPVVLGAVALGMTAVPMPNKTRSICFGATGGLAGVAFVGGLVVGYAGLAVASLAGGALLLTAAAFPLLDTFVD